MAACVTNGIIGIHFQRNQRVPVIHLLILRQFFAWAGSTKSLHWAIVACGNAATGGML
jgi:hypothetical protein